MKRLVVFGATGGTGRALVEQALAAGHTVTAVARRPEAVGLQHARLTVLAGDVLTPASLEPAIAGHDAVLSALGVRARAPTTVCGEGVANILATPLARATHISRADLAGFMLAGLDDPSLLRVTVEVAR